MKAADLEREMVAAVSALTEIDIEMLVQHGVDRADIAMGMVGSALVRVEGDYYSPDPSGKLAFLTAIRVHYPTTPESPVPDSAVRVGEIVDIVAWHPLRPARWALRVGSAEWLGSIEPQYMGPPPVHIRRSVLSWFRSSCTGLLPLSSSPPDVYRVLSWSTGGLIAEDDQHAAELRAALSRPWPLPRISVAREARRHAA
jgi:hypothetical protein